MPFAEVETFSPFIVSVLTHELAHAMITEATADQAPHWLQEGLAQHVEMQLHAVNPIPGYAQTASLLSFPLIETMLQGFAAPRFVPVAYDEAQWVLHFIESRFGVQSIHRLLAAFGGGKSTEEAVSGALGRSIRQFDHEVWAWCLGEAPKLWPTQVIDYSQARR